MFAYCASGKKTSECDNKIKRFNLLNVCFASDSLNWYTILYNAIKMEF